MNVVLNFTEEERWTKFWDEVTETIYWNDQDVMLSEKFVGYPTTRLHVYR